MVARRKLSRHWKNYAITGSMSVSEQLHTYPSSDLTTVNWWQVRVNTGLGEGYVSSCLVTDIDPNI